MGMSIDEIIKKENEIAAEFLKLIDTHMVDENISLEEMYCDDTEVIEEYLQRYKVIADYHSTIANTLCKYQKIKKAYKKYLNDMVTNIYADGKFIKALREVLEDGNVD